MTEPAPARHRSGPLTPPVRSLRSVLHAGSGVPSGMNGHPHVSLGIHHWGPAAALVTCFLRLVGVGVDLWPLAERVSGLPQISDSVIPQTSQKHKGKNTTVSYRYAAVSLLRTEGGCPPQKVGVLPRFVGGSPSPRGRSDLRKATRFT